MAIHNMNNTITKDNDVQTGFEQIIKYAMPLTFGFLVLLVGTGIYGLGQIPGEMMATPFSITMEIIVSMSVIFSLTVFALTFLLVKALKKKTSQLEQQNNDLGLIVKQKTDELLQAEKLAAIGELGARIAHDIRNPLTIIMNTIEVIKMKNGVDEKLSQHYERINKAVMRIAHQINDVMDFVKDNPIQVRTHLFSDIITEVLESTKIPDKVKLKIYDSDIWLDCDFNKMVAVFKNLLLNAVQSINGEGKISIRILERNNTITIEVEDSGPTIPEAVMPKIFDPLFTTKQEGTGLGLSICKKIIEKHGGIISVRNNENFGKTFSTKLPKVNVLFARPQGGDVNVT
ncbi:MAG: ATP-binding protein [Candidatus Nitrosotenuis sp.]